MVVISASPMCLGRDSLILNRISGSGKASIKWSSAKRSMIFLSALGYACLVSFLIDWANSDNVSLFPFVLALKLYCGYKYTRPFYD